MTVLVALAALCLVVIGCALLTPDAIAYTESIC
jgi:hypothetical protein